MKSKEFKKLQAEWYAKLRESGFKDCEDDRENLHRYTKVVEVNEEREYYYRACAWFLHDHRWRSPQMRRIWELHCQGIGRPTISKMLSISEGKVRWALNCIAEEMKSYDPERSERKK